MIHNLRTLSLSDTLYDDLLSSLRRDTAKADIFDDLFMHITRAKILINFNRLFSRKLCAQERKFRIGHDQPLTLCDVVARVAIDCHFDIRLLVVSLLCRGGERQFDGFKDNVFGYAFLVRNGFGDHQDFFVHSLCLTLFIEDRIALF